MTSSFLNGLFIGVVLWPVLLCAGSHDPRVNWEEELEAMVGPVEPLCAPVYQRERGIGLGETGISKEVFVVYKASRPGLKGEILLADITHRFLHSGWFPGLPLGVSSDSELQFYREDFSPAPGMFSIHFAILTVGKDGDTVRCSYWFQTKSSNDAPIALVSHEFRSSLVRENHKTLIPAADDSATLRPFWGRSIELSLEPRADSYPPPHN
jgi:hypothetical protein